jgi:hypothetical protein
MTKFPVSKFDPDKKFIPCPAGMQRAVLVDVAEEGTVGTGYGPKEKTRLIFESEHKNEAGYQYTVHQSFNNTWGGAKKPSGIRMLIDTWRGMIGTDEFYEDFDLDSMIGKPAIVNVVHNPDSKGNIWANIKGVNPMMAGMEALRPSGKYVMDRNKPVKDRLVNKPKKGSVAPVEEDPQAEAQDSVPWDERQ